MGQLKTIHYFDQRSDVISAKSSNFVRGHQFPEIKAHSQDHLSEMPHVEFKISHLPHVFMFRWLEAVSKLVNLVPLLVVDDQVIIFHDVVVPIDRGLDNGIAEQLWTLQANNTRYC